MNKKEGILRLRAILSYKALCGKRERERFRLFRLGTGFSSCVVRIKRCVRDRVVLL